MLSIAGQAQLLQTTERHFSPVAEDYWYSLLAEMHRYEMNVYPGPFVTPVPLKLTVCGLFPALSVTTRVAERVPVAAGENVT
jgi:hypothetical protein